MEDSTVPGLLECPVATLHALEYFAYHGAHSVVQSIMEAIGEEHCDELPWSHFPKVDLRMGLSTFSKHFMSKDHLRVGIPDDIINSLLVFENTETAKARRTIFSRLFVELLSFRLLFWLRKSPMDFKSFIADFQHILNPSTGYINHGVSLVSLKEEFGTIAKLKPKSQNFIMKLNQSIKLHSEAKLNKYLKDFLNPIKDELGKPTLWHLSVDYEYQLDDDIMSIHDDESEVQDDFGQNINFDVSEETNEPKHSNKTRTTRVPKTVRDMASSASKPNQRSTDHQKHHYETQGQLVDEASEEMDFDVLHQIYQRNPQPRLHSGSVEENDEEDDEQDERLQENQRLSEQAPKQNSRPVNSRAAQNKSNKSTNPSNQTTNSSNQTSNSSNQTTNPNTRNLNNQSNQTTSSSNPTANSTNQTSNPTRATTNTNRPQNAPSSRQLPQSLQDNQNQRTANISSASPSSPAPKRLPGSTAHLSPVSLDQNSDWRNERAAASLQVLSRHINPNEIANYVQFPPTGQQNKPLDNDDDDLEQPNGSRKRPREGDLIHGDSSEIGTIPASKQTARSAAHIHKDRVKWTQEQEDWVWNAYQRHGNHWARILADGKANNILPQSRTGVHIKDKIRNMEKKSN